MSQVAIVGPIHPLRGGIALHTARWAAALRTAGHSVQVISWQRQYPAVFFPGRSQLDPGKPVCDLGEPPPRDVLDSVGPGTWRSAADEIIAAGAEVAVLQRWHPFFAPALASVARRLRRAGVRVVWMVHNVRPHEGGAALALFPLVRLGYAREDICLTHSASQARVLEEIGVRGVIRTIAHPAPARAPEYDAARARRELELPVEGSVFLFFGYVRAYKGVDVLLDALARLPREDASWCAVVAGEWYIDRAAAEGRLARDGLDQRVRLLDRFLPEDEVGRLFAAASIVVLPYRSGTQSGVVPQAWAHGRPVITTRVGSVADTVVEGETGLVVAPEDPAALAAALGQVLDGASFSPQAIAQSHAAASWEPLVAAVADVAAGTPA